MSPVNCRMAVGGAGTLRPLPQKCWSPTNQTASWRIIRFLIWPLAGGVAEVVDRPVVPYAFFFFFCIPSLSFSLGSPAHTRIPAFCFGADQLYDFQFVNCEFNPRPCRLGSLTGIPTSRCKIPVSHRGTVWLSTYCPPLGHSLTRHGGAPGWFHLRTLLHQSDSPLGFL